MFSYYGFLSVTNINIIYFYLYNPNILKSLRHLFNFYYQPVVRVGSIHHFCHKTTG